MPTPTFSQPERRNFLVPAILVSLIIAAAFALIYFFTPHRVADVQVTQVSDVAKHFSLAGPTVGGVRVIGASDIAEDDLYVLATVRIHDDLKLPLFIKDLTGVVTTADGANLTASALEKQDLDSVYQAFPSVKKASGPPLLREIKIAPGDTAEGTVILHFPTTEDVWKQRTSASITVEFYHQDPITVSISQ